MKTLKFVLFALLAIGFTSCEDDIDVPQLAITSETYSNLYAPQEGGRDQFGNPLPISGEFTKFDFASGTVTTSETDWDIAFRGTTIIINGGASFGTLDEPARSGNGAVYITNGTMASVTEVDLALLIQDTVDRYAIITGSGNGWYNYAGSPTHLITPIPGKILVVKTRDGKYAKLEILSYYKDAPLSPDAFTDLDKYYTFNYVYQPNLGVRYF